MARFDLENFISVSSDGGALNIFSAKFRDIRFKVASQATVVVDARYEANLKTLSYDQYEGDSGLWWAILMYNGLQDPINDVIPGTVLRIPKRSEVIALLESQYSRQGAVRL